MMAMAPSALSGVYGCALREYKSHAVGILIRRWLPLRIASYSRNCVAGGSGREDDFQLE